MGQYRKFAAPTPDAEGQPFWDAARKGDFMVKFCNDCGKAHWYPRTVCPLCGSLNTEYRPGSGKGTIYTYTVMRRAKVPYCVAYVELEEGPRMMTNIVDCDLDSIKIGQTVELVFVPTEEGAPPVPCFKPV